MIFVTVGTQFPFNRLIGWVDVWAAAHPEQEVFVQCGVGGDMPKHASFSTAMTPADWEDCFNRAKVVVSHAGMGTILKSLDAGKPLVIVPRLAALNEHRNDHQLATAHQLKMITGLTVVEDEQELNRWLDNPPMLSIGISQDNHNLNHLCAKLRTYVNGQ